MRLIVGYILGISALIVEIPIFVFWAFRYPLIRKELELARNTLITLARETLDKDLGSMFNKAQEISRE